ncbi:MAG: hypothetical protein F6J98_41070 [Moorea sp. SIO4G2]|nr:hypothetical protein [Moorena sp. SIO4G2]
MGRWGDGEMGRWGDGEILQGYVFKIHPELKTGTCAGEAEKSGTKLPMGKGSPLNAAAKITISPRRKQLSFRGALVFND